MAIARAEVFATNSKYETQLKESERFSILGIGHLLASKRCCLKIPVRHQLL